MNWRSVSYRSNGLFFAVCNWYRTTVICFGLIKASISTGSMCSRAEYGTVIESIDASGQTEDLASSMITNPPASLELKAEFDVVFAILSFGLNPFTASKSQRSIQVRSARDVGHCRTQSRKVQSERKQDASANLRIVRTLQALDIKPTAQANQSQCPDATHDNRSSTPSRR